jgi:hypothetical protein
MSYFLEISVKAKKKSRPRISSLSITNLVTIRLKIERANRNNWVD